MIIQHNMAAMNSRRQQKINTTAKAKSSEKLASGFKINRAADDAAGLAISEKMRSQVRGLNRASANAEEGVSLIQVADGALEEVHAILQRMNELATQAANDTNTDMDRAAIQQEIDQLRASLNGISNDTTFNDRTVLKAQQLVEVDGGDYQATSLDKKYVITPNATNVNTNPSAREVWGVYVDFKNVNEGNVEDLVGKSFTSTCTDSCDQVFTFKFTKGGSSEIQLSTSPQGRTNMTVNINVDDVKNGQEVVDKIIELVKGQNETGGAFASEHQNTGNLHIGHANGIASDGTKLILYKTNSTASKPNYSPGMGQLKAGDMLQLEETLHLQIGAKEGQAMDYELKTINTATLKLENLSVVDHEAATKTMNEVQDAINSVSKYRGYLGAKQNALEAVMKYLDNTAENAQAAESRIRDTDMEAEIVEQSKANILEQVSQSMLAQANTNAQGILSLLQ